MELKKLEYKNVYGHLSGSIKFEKGENFLVGINGCGKTTVLKLIRWIICPSLPDLCTLEHELIILTIKHKGHPYKIQSSFNGKEHSLNLIGQDELQEFRPITTRLHVHPREIGNQIQRMELQAIYQRMTPESDEINTWTFLTEELPNAVFVDLGRGMDNTNKVDFRNTNRRLRSIESPPPDAVAIDLIRDAFNKMRKKLVDINDKLNCRVLELSFFDIIDKGRMPKAKANEEEMLKNIIKLKDKFRTSSTSYKYSKALSSNEVKNAAIKYLEQLENLLASSKEDDRDIWILLNQQNLNRAADMLNLFEEHEVQAEKVQYEIETFRKVINSFLDDSDKNIVFNENTGTPSIVIKSKNKELRISELSSGETQIVILLSYIAFLAKEGLPIIIDEPEISLHVEWQRLFVKAIKKVLPSGCQIIMATHSPEICGMNDVNVQALTVRRRK